MKKWLTMIIGLFALNTHALTFYVDASAAPGGDGTSWGTAYCFLQDALDQTVAERNDEVWIADGTYHPDDGLNVTEGDRTASFHIKDSVTLYGGFDGGETSLLKRDWQNYRSILSGEIFSEKIFWSLHICHAINATFDGIEIIRGNANGSGEHEHSGGVVGVGDLFANNCLFSENSAAGDGGVTDASDAIWTVENCTFSNNSTDGFGGVANSGVWIVGSCSFEKNSAYYGGVAKYGVWTVKKSIFTGNSSSSGGGVVFCGEWEATECIFSGNSAGSYGGVDDRGVWAANNCVFIDNSATMGGVSYGYDKIWIVNNCTFVNNSSPHGCVAWYGLWTAFNCVFADKNSFYELQVFKNKETQAFPMPNPKRAKNIIVGGTNGLPVGVDIDIGSLDWIIDANPLFVNTNNLIGVDGIWGTADDGLRLQTNSPAIGQGNDFFLPLDTYDMDNDGVTNEPTPLDIANFLRVQNETLDLGAYEYGDSTEVLYTLNILSSSGGTTEPSGMKNYSDGASTSILASATSGYLFDSWSGNIASSSNPLNLTMHSNITVTANFAQDSTDPDNDGLSNYEEAVVHGSNPLLPDTSGDGILDGEAVDAGANPLIDHSNILQIVQNRPGGFDLYSDDTIHDLNVGKLMIQPAGSGRFSIRYTVEESTNLQTWTVYETFEREFTNATPKAYIRVHGREPQ